MSDESEFIKAEAAHIEETVRLLEELLNKEELSRIETIAFATLLQNIYMGIENILRCQIQVRGFKIPKSESWHKDLLRKGLELGLVTSSQFDSFKELLGLRHAHMHGYGYMLDVNRLRELAAPVPALVREYLARIAPSD